MIHALMVNRMHRMDVYRLMNITSLPMGIISLDTWVPGIVWPMDSTFSLLIFFDFLLLLSVDFQLYEEIKFYS